MRAGSLSLDSFHVSAASPARCRVGIAGFRTVGCPVDRRLAAESEYRALLTHICDRRAVVTQSSCAEQCRPSAPKRTSRFDDLPAGDVDVIVGKIGGAAPAVAWIRAALEAGKSVVTANSQSEIPMPDVGFRTPDSLVEVV